MGTCNKSAKKGSKELVITKLTMREVQTVASIIVWVATLISNGPSCPGRFS